MPVISIENMNYFCRNFLRQEENGNGQTEGQSFDTKKEIFYNRVVLLLCQKRGQCFMNARALFHLPFFSYCNEYEYHELETKGSSYLWVYLAPVASSFCS